MSEAVVLPVVSNYSGLVAALTERRRQLGWSQLELDERAGFPAGYTGKLEVAMRTAGQLTMPLWCEALGMKFLPIITVTGTIEEQRAALEAIERPRLKGNEVGRKALPAVRTAPVSAAAP